jgi:hypothetical protein
MAAQVFGLSTLAGLLPAQRLQPLLNEAEELTKICNATRTTTKRRSTASQKSRIINHKSSISRASLDRPPKDPPRHSRHHRQGIVL